MNKMRFLTFIIKTKKLLGKEDEEKFVAKGVRISDVE